MVLPSKPISGRKLFCAFLKRNDITDLAAGKALQVSNVTVHDWKHGVKAPRETNRQNIEVWTHGEVPASAWPAHERADVAPFERPSGAELSDGDSGQVAVPTSKTRKAS